MADDQDRKPYVHELSAAPFHFNRPWYSIDADLIEIPDFSGAMMVLCSDGVEREATRDRDEITLAQPLPDGVTVKAWRQI